MIRWLCKINKTIALSYSYYVCISLLLFSLSGIMHGMKRRAESDIEEKDVKQARRDDDLDEKVAHQQEACSEANAILHKILYGYYNKPDCAILGIDQSLAEGASLAAVNNEGINSICIALQWGLDDSIITHMLTRAEHIMEPEEKIRWINYEYQDTGVTPLLVAACNGRLSLITILLKHGAYLNVEDKRTGDTCSHFIAGYVGNLELLRDLVNTYNMNFVYRNRAGNKPAEIARGRVDVAYQFLIGKQYGRRIISAMRLRRSVLNQVYPVLQEHGVLLPLIDIIAGYVWPRPERSVKVD